MGAKLQSRFLSGLGCIFLIAFLSYYHQFPGLVSSSGIEPSGRIFSRAFPKLHEYVVEKASISKVRRVHDESVWAIVDVLLELASLTGILLSTLATIGFIHHGVLFLTITFLYYFLVQLGGVFYSFQWDTLLLETGWLASMCITPWSHRILAKESENKIGNWPMRFLLFKLMFMAGVVKIQADCPTWNNLTALEYHFATQCLPSPLAWFAHQLHPLIQRFGVAMTLLIEIQGAFLLIAPIHEFRRIGAILQILLQVLIILTGNYNFFNLLTILLCIPCLDKDDDNSFKDEKNYYKDDESSEYVHYDILRENTPEKKKHIERKACITILVCCFLEMFRIQMNASTNHQLNIKLSWNKEYCEKIINVFVPMAIVFALIFLLNSIRVAIVNRKEGFATFIRALVCITCLGTAALPFMNLSVGLRTSSTMTMLSNTFMQPFVQIQPFHFSNSYGLFRRMTGVGQGNYQGYGGLPQSVVARPEIIMGARLSTGEFKEINFSYKPGDLDKVPKQIAPHQPRLDWQMWFAALGNYSHNPWFINLTFKLLQGCRPVLNLLDESSLVNEGKELISIHSTLYNYDFAPWKSSHWWLRSAVNEYVPNLEQGNESLKSFLSSQGYKSEICYKPGDHCANIPNVKGFNYLKSICDSLSKIREIYDNPGDLNEPDL